jgi:tryptophan synthase alpha chain
MNRISSVFQDKQHKALIPYLTSGYPDIETSLKAILLLAENGADIIELGIPFSDPMADGTTIQESSHQALLQGINTKSCLELASRVREKSDIPLVFMTYYNPVYHYGLQKFCRACTDHGIDGLIIPDLPPEEGEDMESAAKINGLDLIYLLAPTSTEERIKMVSEKSKGYIYIVTVTGVTGSRDHIPDSLSAFIERVNKFAEQPLCAGFGISTPQQAAQISKMTDGVIVGSRMIQSINEDPSLESLKEFTVNIRKALDETA